MRIPGFLSHLQQQIKLLTIEEEQKLNAPGALGIHGLLSCLLRPTDHTLLETESITSVDVLDPHDANLLKIGEESFAAQEVAVCVVATNPAALLQIPNLQMSLLTAKLLQSSNVKHVWCCVNPHFLHQVKAQLSATSNGNNVKLFSAHEALCLTPSNTLSPERLTYCSGTGDLFQCVGMKECIQDFVATGGKYIYILDVRNVFVGLDPILLGHHVSSESAVTCDVTTRIDGDETILCSFAGVLRLVQNFRLQKNSHFLGTEYSSAGSMIIDANAELCSLQSSWHRMQRIKADEIRVQYERFLLDDMTEQLETNFVYRQRDEKSILIETQSDLNSIGEVKLQ